ncbi:intercellular adhesion molecule 1 isoform X1 [Loxodonta africana]|uniref:intercellular adhesion molecule 1 isoform X1 n=2 Tax=Loxodonta africana TaxID=9785 RepID=UPI000C811F13|nr:intercellular adhesion molecule 1 [Loxodonta africana]
MVRPPCLRAFTLEVAFAWNSHRISLDGALMGQWLRATAANHKGSGGAQVSVHPLEAIVHKGGSVVVNCSATCNQSNIELGLETVFNKKLVSKGASWKVFELSDVQQDSSGLCYATCGDKPEQGTATTSITMYSFPERVELAPLPPWQPVGENFTLRCQVWGGAPRANLSVVLLRGQDELSRQLAVGEPAEVTATMPARREDYGANFSCRAELQLRGLELFKNSSTSRQLRTFALPMTHPLLVAPHILEVGEESTTDCSLNEVFPVWEAQVHMALGDRRLSPMIKSNARALLATATVTADSAEEGTQQLMCAVILGNQTSLETRQTVTIYSFPAPKLTLSEVEVSEWTVVTVVCEAHAAAKVTLTGVPAPVPTPPLASRVHFDFNASAEDNGRKFFCSAALEVAGQVLYKNQTQKVNVLYGPRLNEEDCPGNWTWQEGSEETLKCQAWGNPSPELKCLRKGDEFSLPIGDLRPVKREFAGTYFCRAVSKRGMVTRQVVVNVLYHQNYLAVIITVAAMVKLSIGGTAGYLYNRQRKIRKYKLQKAQEAASLKMNTPP